MKKFVLGTVALAAMLAGPAMAADMPLKAPAPAPLWSWSGIYMGANVGYGWGHSSWCTDGTVGVAAGPVFVGGPLGCSGLALDSVDHRPTGWLYGGQVGARVQWGGWVLGVEAMLDGTSINKTDPSVCSVTGCGALGLLPGRIRETKFQRLYSATGSLGWAWDRLMIYAKGGWAGTEVRFAADNLGVVAPPFGSGACGGAALGACLGITKRLDGWTAGVGFEYGLLTTTYAKVSIGFEYDYYKFSNPDAIVTTNTLGVNFAQCAFCNFGTIDVHTVMARANVTVDWGTLWAR
jgi:outer membrane immunogenic protein